MLKRDEELFQLATQAQLDTRELQDASRSIVQVNWAIRRRYEDLAGKLLLSYSRIVLIRCY